MVAMNPQTWDKDVAEIEPGGYLFYDSTRPMPPSKFRDDINVLGVPLTEICNARYTDPRQRQLFKNIIYVGALADAARHRRRRGREADRRAVQGQGQADRANIEALHMGRDYAQAQLRVPDRPHASQRADAVGDRIFVEATTPPALGAVYGGATVAPGIRSRRRPRWPRPSRKHCRALPRRSGRPARTATPSSRPRTSSPRSAW